MAYECTVLGQNPPAAADRLSAPTAEILLPSLLSLLPRGRAWQTDGFEVPVGTSTLHRFWRAIGAGLAGLYGSATMMVLGSTVVTADPAFLDDWETELGLPDPCVQPGATIAARRTAARLRLLPGGASPAFFVCYASRLGWDIAVEDGYLPFECGRSECGGNDGLGDDEFFWTVAVSAADADRYFEAGAGEAGLTPLGERPGRADLECVIRRVAPAHTTVLFRYDARVRSSEVTADMTGITADTTLITADRGLRDAED